MCSHERMRGILNPGQEFVDSVRPKEESILIIDRQFSQFQPAVPPL